jgi:hypothetical protein
VCALGNFTAVSFVSFLGEASKMLYWHCALVRQEDVCVNVPAAEARLLY